MVLEEIHIKFLRVIFRKREFLINHLEDKHLRVISKILDSNGEEINNKVNGYDRIILGDIRKRYINYLKNKK